MPLISNSYLTELTNRKKRPYVNNANLGYLNKAALQDGYPEAMVELILRSPYFAEEKKVSLDLFSSSSSRSVAAKKDEKSEISKEEAIKKAKEEAVGHANNLLVQAQHAGNEQNLYLSIAYRVLAENAIENKQYKEAEGYLAEAMKLQINDQIQCDLWRTQVTVYQGVADIDKEFACWLELLKLKHKVQATDVKHFSEELKNKILESDFVEKPLKADIAYALAGQYAEAKDLKKQFSYLLQAAKFGYKLTFKDIENLEDPQDMISVISALESQKDKGELGYRLANYFKGKKSYRQAVVWLAFAVIMGNGSARTALQGEYLDKSASLPEKLTYTNSPEISKAILVLCAVLMVRFSKVQLSFPSLQLSTSSELEKFYYSNSDQSGDVWKLPSGSVILLNDLIRLSFEALLRDIHLSCSVFNCALKHKVITGDIYRNLIGNNVEKIEDPILKDKIYYRMFAICLEEKKYDDAEKFLNKITSIFTRYNPAYLRLAAKSISEIQEEKIKTKIVSDISQKLLANSRIPLDFVLVWFRELPQEQVVFEWLMNLDTARENRSFDLYLLRKKMIEDKVVFLQKVDNKKEISFDLKTQNVFSLYQTQMTSPIVGMLRAICHCNDLFAEASNSQQGNKFGFFQPNDLLKQLKDFEKAPGLIAQFGNVNENMSNALEGFAKYYQLVKNQSKATEFKEVCIEALKVLDQVKAMFKLELKEPVQENSKLEEANGDNNNSIRQ